MGARLDLGKKTALDEQKVRLGFLKSDGIYDQED